MGFFRKTTPVEKEKMYAGIERLSKIKTGWTWGEYSTQGKTLTNTDKKNAYRTPIPWKGINKKARDLIFSGFRIDSPIDGEKVPEDIEKIIQTFLIDKQIISKVHHALQDMFWQGNGWIEFVCQGNKEPEQPLNGKLLDIAYVNTETITQYKWDDKNDPKFVEFWGQKIGTELTSYHHTRYGQLGIYPDGDNPFYRSCLEIGRVSIKAYVDATKALGDNLVMFGHGFPVINTSDNSNRKRVDEAFMQLEKLKRKELKVGFAGFKDDKFSMLNPGNPNPASIINHFYVDLSAMLEMPMMMLIGEQKGKLTGSKVEMADYGKSIEAIRTTVLSPLFHKMFKLLLGDRWKYEIYWNPYFVDEETEIEQKCKIMEKIGELYSKHSLIDVVEARQMLREHDINIPEDGELDEPEDAEPEPEPMPSDEDNDEMDDNKTFSYHYATDEERRIADELHRQGIRELIEQDERCR